jgi:hypothetical protein
LKVVRNVVAFKRPEVLFVREQVHDLRCVGILGQRFECPGDAVDRDAVAHDIDPRKDDAAVEVLPGIVPG